MLWLTRTSRKKTRKLTEDDDDEEGEPEAEGDGSLEGAVDEDGDTILVGGESMKGKRAKVDKDIVPPHAVDGFWVQRQVSEVYPDLYGYCDGSAILRRERAPLCGLPCHGCAADALVALVVPERTTGVDVF